MATKTLDQICTEAAGIVNVQYDAAGWKTFSAVAPGRVKALYDTLTALGAFAPPPVLPQALLSKALGPTYAESYPGIVPDARPTLFRPVSKPANGMGLRIDPYEVAASTGPASDGDYWSCDGQAAYVPDNSIPGNPGVDRIQTFAYYNHAFAISPRFSLNKTRPGPEPFATQYWSNGVKMTLMNPVCAVRNYAMLSNEALIIYDNGFVGCGGTQTSRGGLVGFDWPLPGYQFPPNKKAKAIALSTSNELALVCIQDAVTGKGQLAVLALEGKCLPFHTLPWIGLPNQGSWSDFKLLGYVDLPFAHPEAVSVASSGFWNGPSSSGGKTLGQIDITDPGTRYGLRQGELGWAQIVATSGYAIVSSKTDGKVAIVDLTPVFQYFRNAYLDDVQQPVTIAARAAGTWPVPLPAANLGNVIWTMDAVKPTTVLAGCLIDRWSADFHKAYIATESGIIHILDTSSLLKRWDWEQNNPLAVVGTVQVGKNPVSMCFARFAENGLPLIPADKLPDPLNNMFHVACRGDRRIDSVVTWGGAGQIYQSISDSRLQDPVCVSMADRGKIMTVADFNGKQVVSFRLGDLYDRSPNWGQVGARWGCGATGNDPFEFAGALSFPGFPFWCGSSNVN